MDNELYLLLGGKAAAYFFPDEDFSSLVFRDHTLNGKPVYILPHPSPLNARWLKDHPAFLQERIETIRRAIHRALGLETAPTG